MRSREPSYYEVALTNRQVLVAFVVLLGCLVAAFFAGVWVGQGNGTTGEAAGPQQAAAEPAGGESDLSFFSEEARQEALAAVEGGGQPPTPAARPGADTTLAEDLEAEEAGESQAGDPQPIAKWRLRRRAEREAEEQRQAGLAQDGSEPSATQGEAGEATPPPTSRREPPSRPAAAAAAPAPAAAGGEVFVIQVLSSRDQAKAREVLAWLQNGGYPASLSTLEQASQLMYRVRVGPYRDRATAESVAEDVRRKFKLDIWIVTE